MKFTILCNNIKREYDHKVSMLEVMSDFGYDPKEKKFICVRVNHRMRELTYQIGDDAEVELLDLCDAEAVRVYEASLRYIFAMAFARCYPDIKIRFSYNISRSVFIHIVDGVRAADHLMLEKIKAEVAKIINADYPFERMILSREEAEKMYKSHGLTDQLEMLQYRPEKTAHLYSCAEYLDYMYSRMVPSTGYIHDFVFRLYAPGFLIQYPRAEDGGKVPPFKDAPTFSKTLKESHNWAKIVGAHTVAGINHEIEHSGPIDFINVNEARHNRMLCELGARIEADIDSISLICIAGPSSSGKTTFANRLRIELLSRGIKPVRISLDDYYLDKSAVPLDEDGKPDLESIEALDIELFNQNMLDLINGETVTLPRFDFQLGHRVPGRTLKIGKNEPIIIEGIHALNDRMTVDIPKSAKFKIFISPQAQMNLDDHTPVSLTDLRLIRRIVRDFKFRNASAEETILMWPSVRRGEFRWIYDTQEGCDYVYNSMLSYELPVMKKYAMPLLQEIDVDSPCFPTAERLMRMLKFFISMEDEWVPSNSLMREFIGGSCYADV